ncbi:hypothetical protein B0O99DRAFT_683136 [Bisporella sp. PMI_857]|nr:hypothetical protein B0O99DRAFT_683136 [Bisporella sp. PMI_857]
MPPLSHPQAQFVPISPDLDLAALVDTSPNFDHVTRLPKEMLKGHSAQSLEQLILLHVVIGGKPLVIEGWEDHLDPYLFSPDWLQASMNKAEQKVRDIPNGVDIPMTMGHYLRSMEQLTNQFTAVNYRNPKRQRLYLKDIDCPEDWAKDLQSLIPETFYYLNECIESRTGGDGATLEPNEYGQMRYGKGAAPAGDLMSSLPVEMRALNMMCYIGHEGTYTPAHREMCASLGHNLMVETSQDSKGEKAGSSLWFMTETKEREVVSEYFLSMLGHDIEVEKHFAQINAWKKAPFNVWVVEQRIGDLILIPPLAPHQVWNRGTRTMKAAWNRTTVDTLELALHEALPRARLVCRDEQYKNKAIVYYTLTKYYDLLQRDTIEPKMWRYGRIKQLLEDFKRLFALYTEILVSEMFAANLPTELDVEMVPYDSNITCSYCRGNIFNRFLTCRSCVEYGSNGEEDTYDICMECFAMGRSCACVSNLSWVEQWEWSKLTQNYETWRQMLVQCDGFFDIQKSPQPIEVARKRYGRKPVAQVCQEQLKLRPWKDIKNALPSPEISEDEPDVDDEGRIKKKKGGKGRHLKLVKGKTHACHICFHQEWNWKLAFCTTCNLAYCYGVLWRAFDLMPQDVMEDRDWSCPRCLHICSCGKCRKNPSQKPYAPKGTLLGHDTKKVADFRSVESLVDFSKTNLTWLRGENDDNPHESARMKKLKEKAEAEKAREDVIDESYLDNGNNDTGAAHQTEDNILDIDPQLLSMNLPSESNDTYRNPLESGTNGYKMNGTEGTLEEQSQHWHGDDDFGGVDFDSFIAENPTYSSGLTAPVAAMVAPDEPVAPPASIAPKRMMGIGYYQQESNGVDKILYDPPSNEAATANKSPVTAPILASLALSDILPKEEIFKKRKHGAGHDDDTEFFANKKQKKAAEVKKKVGILEKEDSDIDDGIHDKKSKQRQPSRNIPKPQTYTDVGEETMPFTEEDLVVVSERISKPDSEANLGELAAQAVSNSSKRVVSETKKRRSTRSIARSASPTVTAAPKRRKSAWLARKEAEETDIELPSEVPKKTAKARKSTIDQNQKSISAISISSDAEGDSDDHYRIEDDGSLFGEDPNASSDNASNDATRASVDLHRSPKNRPVQVANTVNRVEVLTSLAKRKGRPPKIRRVSISAESPDATGIAAITQSEVHPGPSPINNRGRPRKSLIENNEPATSPRRGRPPRSSFSGVGVGRVDSANNSSQAGELNSAPKRRGRPPRSASSIIEPLARSKPRGLTHMLSLKEKLKLKGKPFKIIGGKENQSTRSAFGPSTASLVRVVLEPSPRETSPDPFGPLSPVGGDSPLHVESPIHTESLNQETREDERLVSPDDYGDAYSSNHGLASEEYQSEELQRLQNGATIIRKGSVSPFASPVHEVSPVRQALVNNGPTIIRKGAMLSNNPSESRLRAPPQPSVFKLADDLSDAESLPAKRPTVVRLVSPDEDEPEGYVSYESSSHYSSSESEDQMEMPKLAGRGRGGPVSRGMVARRGRGRPIGN